MDGHRSGSGWFAEQRAFLERLGDVMRRLKGATGDELGDLIDEVNVIAEEAAHQSRPTREELLAFRDQFRGEDGRVDFVAMLAGNLRVFQEITDDLNRPTPDDLGSAVFRDDRAEAARLLDAGVDPNAAGAGVSPPLLLALTLGRREMAELLRRRGATYGFPEAATCGDEGAVRRLLDSGGDIPTRTSSGETLLHLAARGGHVHVARLLLDRGLNPDLADHCGHRPLAAACIAGHPALAHLLVEAGASVGVVEAAYLGDISQLRTQLDAGGDVETRDESGWTPLMAACAAGHAEAARFLLKRGADPNARGTTDYAPSALGLAVAYEREQVIYLLAKNGAEVNERRAGGEYLSSPLGMAVTMQKERSVAALLGCGADPNGPSLRGTPLHACAGGMAAVQPAGAAAGTSARIAALLLAAGADVDACNDAGETSLMAAVRFGMAELARLLIARGADVRAATPDGATTVLSCTRDPMSVAGSGDYGSTQTLVMEALGPEYALHDAAERGDAARAAELLDVGTPPDAEITVRRRFEPWGGGSTPLVAAAGGGHLAVVRLLLGRAAPEGIREDSLDSALSVAELGGHDAVAALLQSAGADRERHRAKIRARSPLT